MQCAISMETENAAARPKTVYERLYQRAAEKQVPQRQQKDKTTKHSSNKRWDLWYKKCMEADEAKRRFRKCISENQASTIATESMLECTFNPGSTFDSETLEQTRAVFQEAGERQRALMTFLQQYEKDEIDFLQTLRSRQQLQRIVSEVVADSAITAITPNNFTFLLVLAMRAVEQQAATKHTEMFPRRMSVLKELTGLQVHVNHLLHQSGIPEAHLKEASFDNTLADQVKKQKWYASRTCVVFFRCSRDEIKKRVVDILKHWSDEPAPEVPPPKMATPPPTPLVSEAAPTERPPILTLEQAVAFQQKFVRQQAIMRAAQSVEEPKSKPSFFSLWK